MYHKCLFTLKGLNLAKLKVLRHFKATVPHQLVYFGCNMLLLQYTDILKFQYTKDNKPSDLKLEIVYLNLI